MAKLIPFDTLILNGRTDDKHIHTENEPTSQGDIDSR